MGFTGAKKTKMEAILCTRLRENHKGEIPLDPHRPLQTVVLVKRKFYDLTKLLIYDVSNTGK